MRTFALLSLLGLAAPAHAQEADPTPEAAARVDFERGVAAMESGDPSAAVRAFEASFAALPYLATAYNLAIAYEAVGQRADAANLLDRILGGELGALGPAEAREARDVYDAVRAHVGTVTLRVEGAEAAWVRVDDAPETRPAGAEPLFIALDPGHHVVHVGAPGHRPRRLLVRAEPGVDNSLRVRFDTRAIGTLRVTVPHEQSARVEIVGVATGPSPLEHDLPAGVYEVGLVERPASRRSVSVEPGALREVSLQLGGGDEVLIGVLVGAAALAVAGAVTGVVVATTESDAPLEEPVFGIIAALSF